ncbi:MAG: SUMF1/EgtB/PvdO family nonheme iron enzyme [Candidatus Syntrophosphaera sp.]|nr:SUMF1/EgtB/PvdO family nonheme iron enzyme [Candidatus Syntrophosphaera sp.]
MNGFGNENTYTILETLNRSRHFCVYRARNQQNGSLVTIKTIEQRWKADYALIRQLKDEAALGLKLEHPNIRRTLALFEEDGTPYLVGEFIQGDRLDAILSLPKADISYETAFKWVLQALDALEYAHASGVLHMNLNPASIIIDPDYDLKIFGFGKSPDKWKTDDPDKCDIHPVLFTPPEVFLDEGQDECSDLYSVGVLAYLLFCGQLPWSLSRRESPSQQKQQTFQRPALNPDLLSKRLPHWLFNILNKALMLDPAKRFGTAAELKNALLTQQDIPYESCLNRTMRDTPQAPVIAEVPLEKLEPVPARDIEKAVEQEDQKKDSTPSAETWMTPEPEIVPEPQPEEPFQETGKDTEPEREPDLEPEEETIPLGPPEPVSLPRSKPAAAKKETVIHIPGADKVQHAELSRMQRLFRIFGIISLLIIGYIVVKYVIIKDKPEFSEVETVTATEADVSEFRVANLPLEMIFVEGDSTVIGHIGPEADDDEFPPREVYVPSFYISPTEITREQWAMALTDYVILEEHKDLPITEVTFNEVLEFCNEKSRVDGLDPCYDFYSNGVVCDFNANGYRLPTEAEWEFAAKGRRRDDFTMYSGSNYPDAAAWYIANSAGRVHPVGLKQANLLGLYDMSGNVSEWVWNWYGRYSYNAALLYSGPESGTDKVIRGGSWKDESHELRVTNRQAVKPYLKTNYIGFRVVRTP